MSSTTKAAAAADDTHYTDPTKGAKVEILQGQGNYTPWYRTLKLAADGKNVDRLIFVPDKEADREAIIAKPTRPTKPNATDAKYQPARGALEGAEEVLQNLFRTDLNAYNADVTEYKLENEEYKEQQERVRDARTLLLCSVNPAIRFSVSSKHSLPSDLMKAIQTLCRMSNAQAQALAYAQIDALKYSDASSTSDLINKITTIQQEIHALEGTYGDEQVISKVLSLLPDAFGDWKRYWNMLSGTPNLPRDVTTLQTQLLHEESQLKANGKLNKKSNDSDKKSKGKGEGKSKEGLHMCKHCKKEVKHDEKFCFDNPANKGKTKEELDQYKGQRKYENKTANVAEADVAEVEKQAKKKLVIAASVIADRDAFESLLNTALSTPSAPVKAPGDDIGELADAAFSTPTHVKAAMKRNDGSSTTKSSTDESFSVPLNKSSDDEPATKADTDVACVTTFDLAATNGGPPFCATCNTIGFHTTDDHDFAESLTKIRESKPKSKTAPSMITPRKPIKPFTRKPAHLYHYSDPAKTPPQEPFERESAGKGDGERSAGVDDLLERCKDVFTGADISRKTMMMLHNAEVQSSVTIMDSGANICIVNDKSMFTEFRKLNIPIGTADESGQIKIEGGGTVTLSLCVDGEETADIMLTTVAYAPTARCNIVSVSWLAEKANVHGNWNKQNMSICACTDDKHKTIIGIAPLIDGLYHLQLATAPDATAVESDGNALAMISHRDHDVDSGSDADGMGSEDEADDAQPEGEPAAGDASQEAGALTEADGVLPPDVVAVEDMDNNPVWVWHRKLGHLGLGSLRKLLKMSEGIDITDEQVKKLLHAVCPVCQISKAVRRIPKEPANRRATRLGEVIHVDIWGPYPVASWNGEFYLLVFTDDATRRSWSAGFGYKDQIPSRFKHLHVKGEKKYDMTIQTYRLDNEMPGYNEIKTFVDEEGITLEIAVPYAHYMNGVRERGFRTERERAAAMMQDATLPERIREIVCRNAEDLLESSSLPESLWNEAFKHALWLKDRAPTRALKSKKTPYEAAELRKPNMAREQIWGSRMFVAYPPEKRRKSLLQARGWMGYFVGHESESVYLVWSPEKGKVLRVDQARVTVGAGLADPHNEPSRTTRLAADADANADYGDEEEDDDPLFEPPAGATTPNPGTNDNEDLHSASPIRNNAAPQSQNQRQELSDGDDLSEGESSDDGMIVRSRFFANMAKRSLPSTTRDYIAADLMTGLLRTDVVKVINEAFGHDLTTMDLTRQWQHIKKADFASKHPTFHDQAIRDEIEATLADAQETLGITLKKRSARRAPQAQGVKKTDTIIFFHLLYHEDVNQKSKIAAFKEVYPDEDISLSQLDKLGGRMFTKSLEDIDELYPGFADNDRRMAIWEKILATEEMSKPTNAIAYHRMRDAHHNKCRNCIRYTYRCDGGYPCKRCIQLNTRACRIQVSENELILYYPPGKTPSIIADHHDGSPECCFECDLYTRTHRGGNRDGDGNFPCNYCKAALEHMLEQVRLGNIREDRQPSIICRKPALNGGYRTYTLRKAIRARRGGPKNTTADLYDAPEFYDPYEDDISDVYDDEDEGDDLPPLPTTTEDQETNTQLRVPGVKLPEAFLAVAGMHCMHALADFDDYGPIPRSRAEALQCKDAAQWIESMDDEYASLKKNHTWDVVPKPANRKVLNARWVYNRKRNEKNQVVRHKSRWVAKGFLQIYGLDFDETYASVVKSPSYRLFFALQAKLLWACQQLDIVTAYLNGDVEHEIYVYPPEGYPEALGMVLRLNKALYGLKQSGRQWYHKLREFLLSIGWRVALYDQSIFISPSGQFMTIYVDDIRVYAKTHAEINAIKAQIADRFATKDLGEGSYYLGMHVHTNAEGDVHIHQTAYLKERLQKYGLEKIRPAETPMDHNRKLVAHTGERKSAQFQQTYQSMTGSLNYASIVSRPDISNAVGILCRFNSNPNDEHLAAANRCFAYLLGNLDLGPHYKSYVEGEQFNDLYMMCDADWAGCPDTRRSTTGWVMMLSGAPISWASKRQDCNTLSSCEAEYIAGSIAAQEAMWMKNMINDLQIPGLHIDKIPFYVDNQSAIACAKNPEHHNRMKHIENRMHFLRGCVQDGHIEICWVPSAENIADILTKPLDKNVHHKLRTKMGIVASDC